MRLAVFNGAGKPFTVEQRPDPTPGAGEMVLRVGRCGICGTDLHMTSGHGADFPDGSILGHEYAGEVVAVGAGVDRFRLGDRVSAMPATGCGRCIHCLGGFPLLCAAMQGMAGGFAEYVRCAASSSIRLPSILSLADGALVEPLAVGLHGVSMAEMRPGARVLVLGVGSVGLAAIYWARKLGAGRIAAVSRSARRADMALALGASCFVSTGASEAERLTTALGGPPDIVFECAGAVGMLNQAITLVRTNGLVVSMGFCTAPDPVLPSMATFKQVRLAFSLAYTLTEFQHVADTLEAGHLEPRAMITETVGLDALPATIDALRGPNMQTKVQLDPFLEAGAP